MAVEQIEISRKVGIDDIDRRMKEIENLTKKQQKILQKLRFVRLRYLGYSVVEACNIEGISIQTGYNWQEQWNDSGFDSLEPRYAGGRPASLSEEQKERFFNAVARDQMTTSQAGCFRRAHQVGWLSSRFLWQYQWPFEPSLLHILFH